MTAPLDIDPAGGAFSEPGTSGGEAKAIEGVSDQRNARLRADTDQSKKVDDLPECQSGAQGAACGYNAFWTDPGTRIVRIGDEARPSILTEPKNGRLPYTAAARGRVPHRPVRRRGEARLRLFAA